MILQDSPLPQSISKKNAEELKATAHSERHMTIASPVWRALFLLDIWPRLSIKKEAKPGMVTGTRIDNVEQTGVVSSQVL